MSASRYEIKFVLNELALSHFCNWMHLHALCKKKFPNRFVNSIYFDDKDFNSVRDNLSGISNRKKRRLRWYLDQSSSMNSAPVFEQKIKLARLGKKQLISLPNLPLNINQIPMDQIFRKLKEEIPSSDPLFFEYLIPTLHVSYLRQYYENFLGLRVTIDQDIGFKSNFSSSLSLSAHRTISYKSYIVELKFDPALKSAVNDLLRPLGLTPTRHSKYLTGLSMFGQAQYI